VNCRAGLGGADAALLAVSAITANDPCRGDEVGVVLAVVADQAWHRLDATPCLADTATAPHLGPPDTRPTKRDVSV
jgi:hypothetical protein